MSMRIQIEGLDRAVEAAKALGSVRPIVAGLRVTAQFIKGKLAKYPEQPERRSIPFASDRQRRHFFYLLRRGDIEVPYRRGISPGTERHGQSWTIRERARGLVQVIGSDTSYGPLLQDVEEQTAFHRQTGWRTIQDIVDEHSRAASQRFIQAHDAVIRRMMR